MRSQHDNTALKRDTAARQTEGGGERARERERDTAEDFRGVCFPPDLVPNFQVNFPPASAGNCAETQAPRHIWAHEALDEKEHRLYLDFI